MHAYNIVRARARQREGAPGTPTCMRKGVFHARRSSFSGYWLSTRSRASRLCRSARTSVSCALQEGRNAPRDHYVKTEEMHSTSKTESLLPLREKARFAAGFSTKREISRFPRPIDKRKDFQVDSLICNSQICNLLGC